MKKTLVFLTVLYCTVCCFGQKFAVKWSDNFKLTSGIFTNNIYLKSLPAPDASIISLFNIIKTSSFNNNYLLVKFNDRLEVAAQLELNYPKSAQEGFIDFVKLQGNYYLIEYRYTSKENVDIVSTKLDTKTFQRDGTGKKLTTFDEPSSGKPRMVGIGIGNMYKFKAWTAYSADSSKMMLLYEPDQPDKDPKGVQVLAFNANSDRISTTSYEWSEPFKKVEIVSSLIDNNGSIYLCYNTYEKSFEKAWKKSDGDKVPAYTSNMLVISSQARSTYSFNTGGKFIHDISIGYDDHQMPLLTGLYKEKYNGRISGVFKTPAIGSTKLIAGLMFTPFPTDLLEKADADNQGKKDGNKAGLDNEFYTGQTISVSDGVNYMITEYFDLSGDAGADYTRYTKGDFIITTFLPDGKVQFVRLPRYQSTMNNVSSTNITGFNSFTTDYIGSSLYVFYNDDEDNIAKNIDEKPTEFKNEKKSVLVAAILNHEGKLVSRKSVYSHRDMDGYVTNLRFSKVKGDTYVIFAVKAGNFKHQTMVGLLTVSR